MNSTRSREELWEKVISAFSQEPEIGEIYTFGREVDGETDRYSDLDLIFCSTDLQETQRKHREILSRISPIVGSYLIVSTEDHLAEMVMLEDYSPYQKIDLSIAEAVEEKQPFGPFKLVRKREPNRSTQGSRLRVEETRDDLQNRMNDILFSVPRFTKCLFRQDRDMYRRWVGVVDQLFVLLFEKHFGWQREPRNKLIPPEYKALYKALAPLELRSLDTILPMDGKVDLASSFRAGIHQFISLSKEKAVALGARLDGGFIEYIGRFMDVEIDRFLDRSFEI